MTRYFLAPAAIAALNCPALADAAPPAFTDLSYADAIAQNDLANDRFLIVKFTAEWCAPCKVMDRTTWSDDAVVAYLNEHQIPAIQVDVDAQRDVAQANSITAMPTMVLYRDGKEFDRAIGAMDAGALTAWLDSARAGKTRAEVIADAAQPDEDGRVDVRARMDHAKQLAQNGKHEEATAEYVWLWDNMLQHRRSMSGVRGSFMAGDMQRLARDSAHARAAFAKLRDAAWADHLAHPDEREPLFDWLVLNIRVLEDHETMSAWIDELLQRPDGMLEMQKHDHILFAWMISQDRWALAGSILSPADREVAKVRDMLENLRRAEANRGFDAGTDRYAQRKFTDLHAAYLAANREPDAWAAAEALFDAVPGEESVRALCDHAIAARVVRDRHLELAADLPDLLERLTAAQRAQAN